MTVKEAISEYQFWVENMTGDISDDTLSSDLAIYHRLRTARATVLKTLIERGERLSEEHLQILRCIELEEVDRVDCPFVPTSGCVWLKSTCDIPDFISLQSVSTHLGQSYSYVRWDRLKEKVGGRLKSAAKEKFYSFKMDKDKVYLYIYNDEFIKNITLTGIFEDPIEATAFCGDDKNEICSPMDTSFHTSSFVMYTVSKTAWDLMTKARMAAKAKFLNNDSPVDNTTQMPQKPQQ